MALLARYLQSSGLMRCLRSRLLCCVWFLLLVVSSEARADGVSAAPAVAPSAPQPAVEQEDSSSRPALRLVLRLMAPLSHGLYVNNLERLESPTHTILGAAVGVIVRDRIWLEGSARWLYGTDNAGHEVAWRAGYLWSGDFQPHRWQVSFPTYLILSSMKRPPSGNTDNHTVHERLFAVGAGGRAVLTRNFKRNALEIGASLEFMVPVSKSPVEGSREYYQDPETRRFFGAGITLGGQFGL